jgi:ATP-binding cassette, subfamily B, bacterial
MTEEQKDNSTGSSSYSNKWEQLKRALGFAKSQRKFVYIIISCTLLVASMGVVEPLIMRFIFDSLGQGGIINNVVKGVMLFLGLAVIKELTGAFSNWLTWRTRIRIHYGLLDATVKSLHRLPFDAHRKEGVGATINKLEKGIQGFINAISEISFNILPALFYLVLAVSVMFTLDWRMTLVVLVFAPLPGIIAAYAAPTQKKREKFLLNRWAQIYSRFNEVLSGIVTVRSFAMEDYEKKRFLDGVEEANSKVVNGIKFDSKVGACQNMVVLLARISAIGLGGYLVLKGQLTLGTLIAFLSYIGGFFTPVQAISNIYKVSQTATASLEHIFSILDSQDYLGDAPNAIEVKELKGDVSFENIYFSYKPTDEPLIKGIDLRVKSGETVAIVGPSGSGKSTIMALLQRFYDPIEGSIKIDGIDLRQLKQKSIRRQIGVVLQDALLFNESIKDNIAYGRPDASNFEIVEAAKAANAHEFILRTENGYDTLVGERGGRLSMGERQRIAIARALLKDPPILILDEATSALDAEVEAHVQEALERLIQNRTTFIIAHRLSTVVNADRIVVFKEGKIIESGCHTHLMDINGYYKSLVDKQTRGLISA